MLYFFVVRKFRVKFSFGAVMPDEIFITPNFSGFTVYIIYIYVYIYIYIRIYIYIYIYIYIHIYATVTGSIQGRIQDFGSELGLGLEGRS